MRAACDNTRAGDHPTSTLTLTAFFFFPYLPSLLAISAGARAIGYTAPPILRRSVCSPSVALAPSIAMAAYASFVDDAHVQIHPSIRLQHSSSAGFHAVAQYAIPEGAQLFAVPLPSCMDLTPERAAGLGELAAAGCPPLCISALQLLLRKGDTALAPHAAILHGLPPIRNVATWGPRENALLRGTMLERAALAMPLRERFRTIVAPFLRTHAMAAVTEDDFIRAATLVMSRCFHADGCENAATPAFSLTGGGGESATQHDSGSAIGTGAGHHPTRACTHNARVGDSFRFYALRPIAAGEQVYLSYGALSDAQLLHTYGFVPEEGGVEAHVSGASGSTDSFSSSSSSFSTAAAAAASTTSTSTSSIFTASAASANPHNAVHIATDAVISSLKFAVCPIGSKGERGWASTVAPHLRALLGPHGVTLRAHADDDGDDVGSSVMPLWRSLLPSSLLTALQVAGMELADISLLKGAGGGPPVQLSLPLLSALVAKSNSSKLNAAAAAAAAVAAAEDDDDDAEDIDDVAHSWSLLIPVVQSALQRYPSSLKADRAWYTGVRARMLAHEQHHGGASSSTASAAVALGKDSANGVSDGDAPALQQSCFHPSFIAAAARCTDASSSCIPTSIATAATEASSISSLSSSSSPSSSSSCLSAASTPAASRLPAASSSLSASSPSALAEDPWAAGEASQIELGAVDDLYRGCRLIAMREKDLLWSIAAGVVSGYLCSCL